MPEPGGGFKVLPRLFGKNAPDVRRIRQTRGFFWDFPEAQERAYCSLMPHVDLLELPYFDGIDIDTLISLVDRMNPIRFPPGHTLFHEDQGNIGALYIVTRGQVELTKRAPDGPMRLAALNAPTLLGEVELFTQVPAVATVTTLTDIDSFALSRQAFETLMAEHHPAMLRFTYNVARVACHRLAVADTMLARKLGAVDLAELRRQIFGTNDDLRAATTTGSFFRAK